MKGYKKILQTIFYLENVENRGFTPIGGKVLHLEHPFGGQGATLPRG
jgi:hypothetical protein